VAVTVPVSELMLILSLVSVVPGATPSVMTVYA
jgi:hypothetical protein